MFRNFTLTLTCEEGMALIYRSMIMEGGKPLPGTDTFHLGVRVKPHKCADLGVNPDNTVSPGTGGMSVNPSFAALAKRLFLVSRRLKDKYPHARAPENVHTWRMGSGAFAAGHVAEGLILRPDEKKPPTHGVVEPNEQKPLEDYRQALAATKDQWELGEE
jgi:hypothetical protein